MEVVNGEKSLITDEYDKGKAGSVLSFISHSGIVITRSFTFVSDRVVLNAYSQSPLHYMHGQPQCTSKEIYGWKRGNSFALAMHLQSK